MPVHRSVHLLPAFDVPANRLLRPAVFAALLFSLISAPGAPVISEIMYHAAHGDGPEVTGAEWIEIHNPDDSPADLSGWRFADGVDFVFGAGTLLAPDARMVIAADPAAFSAMYPGASALGPWAGSLRNSGERIALEDAGGNVIDEVEYADEGNWATRVRGEPHFGHMGWRWEALHDGGGRSLELRDSNLPNEYGGSWAASLVNGGTPGAVNSNTVPNAAPLIVDVSHHPAIPHSTGSVRISASVLHPEPVQPVLHWRVDGSAASFATSPMEYGGGTRYSAVIPPQADRAIVEFYLSAASRGIVRTWPAASRPSGLQETNALYQVDDTYDAAAVRAPGVPSTIRIIMTDAERAELGDIGDADRDPPQEPESNALMNATFISAGGNGTEVRYNVGVRNRGASSRSPPPNNFHVDFRSDDPWNGVTSVKLNAREVDAQVAGSFFFRWFGIEAADAAPVRLLVNGTNLARSDATMHGLYAMVETFDRDFAENHFPLDGDGNLYQVRDDEITGQQGNLRNEGTDPDRYRDTYFKQTNESADDWSGLIALTAALNAPASPDYLEGVEAVADVGQWLRFFAVDQLAGNLEGGLITGKGDDYILYQRESDGRFVLLPHDLDSVLNLGSGTARPTDSIFSHSGVQGLGTLFQDPRFIQRYFATLLDLLERDYTPGVMDSVLERAMEGFPVAGPPARARTYIANRAAAVLARIPQTFSMQSSFPQTQEGYLTTTGAENNSSISGTYDASRCLSVLVNGLPAVCEQRNGRWSFVITDYNAFFRPGLNRLVIQAFTGRDGTGEVVHSEWLTVVHDRGSGTAVSGILDAGAPGNSLVLLMPEQVPGRFLARVELRKSDGSYDRDAPETQVALTTDAPGVTLEPATIAVQNGFGSAMVVIRGVPPQFFSLTATAGSRSVIRPVTVIEDSVGTPVPAVLEGTESRWSGVIRVSGDVVVPADHTLIIEPGTVVLMQGTSQPRSTTGASLIVLGAIRSAGTASQPVTFCAMNPGAPWGQIRFENSRLAGFTYTNIHEAGHSPAGGHTNHGRVLQVLGSEVTFDSCNITDHRGKIGETAALNGVNPSITFRNSHWARSVMGVEAIRCGVLLEDCFISDMLGRYREDGIDDDDDGIYLHGAGPGQSLVLRRVTIANCGDDGIDSLRADGMVIEDVIVRDAFDKGMSMLGGSAVVTRSRFTDNGIGFSAKDGSDVGMDFVTIGGSTRIGVQAENKTGSDGPSRFRISNSIIQATDPVRTDYSPDDIAIRYSNIGEAWSGDGNLMANPQFVNAAADDFRIAAGSPSRNAADPALPPDADGSRRDQGCYPFVPAAPVQEVHWVAGAGPWRVTNDVVVPPGVRLVIDPGTSVYVAPGRTIEVRGSARIEGTPLSRIQFSGFPGAPFEPDPASTGLPAGPPKWAGIRFINTMDPANRVAHVDIHDAQDPEGSVGIIRSQCVLDDVRFRGTHVRMVYTDSASTIIENCTFPDVFPDGEEAAALGLDNISEQIKGIGEPPEGGRYIIRGNTFGTNKGHNDVIDIDSGRLPKPIVQIVGNRFAGVRDELLDLGGDVYVAGNLFARVIKDEETSDRGYANAISTGDAGTGTTIVAARNVFHDVDHAMTLKADTFTVFENNTVSGVHPDFVDRFGNPNVSGVIAFYVPGDTSPSRGGGAYVAGNVFHDLVRVFANADLGAPGHVTPIETEFNVIDPSMPDAVIGPNHGGATIDSLSETNFRADPGFIDAARGDFRLAPGSPAAGTGRFREDAGAFTGGGIMIAGEPPPVTGRQTASLRVGGPGMFGYRYRLNGGAWSAPADIGDPRRPFKPGTPTVREATIELSGLSGTCVVEVLGRNFAGDWQEVPTVSRAWTVDTSGRLPPVISEVLTMSASGGSGFIELENPNATPFRLDGLTLAFGSPSQGGIAFGFNDTIPGFGRISVPAGAGQGGSALVMDRMGGSAVLTGPAGEVLDTVSFGPQIPGHSISRNSAGEWQLSVPTPDSPNRRCTTGDLRRLRLNEWLAATSVMYRDDWIELHNPDSFPVDLSGLHLTDRQSSGPERYTFPPLSFIAAGGYLRLTSGGEAGPGRIPFSLNAAGDRIALLSRSLEPLDAVIFGPQADDVSEGRDWAAPNRLVRFAMPTGGMENLVEGSGSAEFDNLVRMMRHLRITEIMFDPPGGPQFEYVELRNTGTVPLQLAGVRFSDGISFTFPPMILPQGRETVVVADVDAFRSRYGNGPHIAGTFTGRLDNSGETLGIALPPPLEAGILRFRYDPLWVPEANGGGASLALATLTAIPSEFGNASTWHADPTPGGSPGGISQVPATFDAWCSHYGVGTATDEDRDGMPSILEYALGSDPTTPAGAHGAAALPVVEPSGDGTIHFVLNLPLHPGATGGLGLPDVTYIVETSDGRNGWIAATTKSFPTPFTGSAAVLIAPGSRTVRVAIPQTDTPTFLRLRVTR